ncbi:hypothetical protein C0585_05255 [Candidatus Woesearchaeota archaeon]|nr:MAG: hypothetical protein C0585_05255 [Candidatus Woesearchaeota archaeon]
MINKNRLKKIEKFIKNGGYFPNSIIINIDTNRKMKFEKAKNEHHSNLDLGVLELPQKYKSAFIIDGQHRLYGYSNLEQKKGHVIPVVAFENLPENEQSELFVDINKEQKSVPANLLRSIMSDFKWGSENPKDAITALKTKIFNELNYKEDSPFYKRIVLSEEKKDEIKCLTLHTLINSGLSKTNFFHSIEKGHINKIGTLMNNNSELTISERYQKSLIKCCEFIDTIFQKIRASLPEQWEAGKTEKGFIAMNNPIAAIIQVSDKLLNFVIEEEKIDTYKFDGKELANKILDYLEPLTDFVKSLTYEEIKRFRNIFGSTAPKKISREFEFAINQRYPEFCPKGLKEWIDSHDGKYNKQCYEIGTFIEKDLIHKKVETNLKNKFGEENWWLQGVPVEVQKGAGIRKIEEQSKKHESNFLTLIEYRKIIQKNWDIMENEFSDPNAKSGKKNKTEWMVSFNNIRKKYSHPQRESCTEEDLNNLKYFKNFLEENS